MTDATPDVKTDDTPPPPVAEVPDTSAYEAKIAELNTEISGYATKIGSLEAELSRAKAANYDLLMKVPATDSALSAKEPETSDSKPVDIDSLFE